jgi:phosphoribosylaminoimidazole-succinocarboxamide synthase
MSGKVRDVYVAEADPEVLLLVASDRVSAYDHVLTPSVPGKGALLTALSRWWSHRLAAAVPHHLLEPPPGHVAEVPPTLADRGTVARRLDMIPIECVARGYLAGSAWREYRDTGGVAGLELPPGLPESARLPEPVFTPATKASPGEHDENITFDDLAHRVGAHLARRLRELTLAVYREGAAVAAVAGLLLADTKLEFGIVPRDPDRLILGDEVLTPDSSRYWEAEAWRPGRTPPMFDKQIVRDWLAGPESGWSPESSRPPPPLPAAVVAATSARYARAAERLMRVP